MDLFKSFLMGGFECSTHRTRDGRRLDMIAATRHDELAAADYARLRSVGIRTVRDGLRWHLIEREPFRYDFSSLALQAAAASSTGTQVIWDYFHYGYPDDIDILSPDFVERFAGFSKAATEFLVNNIGTALIICPVNEMSFFSWAAGRAGIFFPFFKKRAAAIKRQLVRALIACIDASRAVCPTLRWLHTEPAIHVVPAKNTRSAARSATLYRLAQFEALDMVRGDLEPELGGRPEYLDIIGLNYYVHNQWTNPDRRPIPREHPLYRPPRDIFAEFAARYSRPVILAETGIEDDLRPDWYRYMVAEVLGARSTGVPIQGLCLYPIVNHPGWEDSRHCHNALWDYPDENGERASYLPFESAIKGTPLS